MPKFSGVVTTKVSKTVEAESAEAATAAFASGQGEVVGEPSVEVTDIAQQEVQ